MDSYDLFRKLKAGTKFDFKRFRDDAVKLKVIKPEAPSSPHINERRTKRFRIKQTAISTEERSTESVNANLCSQDWNVDKSISILQRNEDALNGKGVLEEARRRATFPVLIEDVPPATKKNKKDPIQRLNRVKQEKLIQFRKLHRIHVAGSDVPDPVETFAQLSREFNIPDAMLANIVASGYTTPTPIQMQAIPILMHKREVLACAPTGSGKTDAFLIPVLHQLQHPSRKGVRVVVVEPTRELAKQVYREATRLSRNLGFRIQVIEKVSNLAAKMESNKLKIDVLITTPNRLIYTLNIEPPILNLDSVEWLIVDESDKLFEAGKQGFRDQLAIIFKACSSNKLRRAMFSATYTGEVQKWCQDYMDNVVTVSVGIRNSAAETVEQELVFVGSEEGKLVAVRDLVRRGVTPPVLVFVQSKERARQLFNELIYDGINVDVIHSDRTQLQRDNVVNSFRAGHIWVLICTDLMGRGIDFIGVNLVINFDFPPNAISYIHRIGRTGRAGKPGKALTFFTEQDFDNLKSIAHVMKDAGCPVPEYMLGVKRKTRKDKQQVALPRESISTTSLYDAEKLRERALSKKRSDKHVRWLAKRKMARSNKQSPKALTHEMEAPVNEEVHIPSANDNV